MDKQKAAAEMIAHALPIAPFEGWNQKVLAQAAVAAGYQKTDVIRVFPGGAMQAADTFWHLGDERLLEDLQGYHLATMKIRERIALAVRLRIAGMEGHREAVRKILALQALPFTYAHGLRSVYRTVDNIWYAVGDNSTDFNFYTKRLLLAGVFSTTLLYWLDDKSAGQQDSWDFLERRIGDVMKIEKVKWQVKSWLGKRIA